MCIRDRDDDALDDDFPGEEDEDLLLLLLLLLLRLDSGQSRSVLLLAMARFIAAINTYGEEGHEAKSEHTNSNYCLGPLLGRMNNGSHT